MLKKLIRPALALSLFCLALGTHAADLTQAQLDRWIAAATEGREWSDQLPEDDDFLDDAAPSGMSLRDHLIASAKEHPEVMRILRKHGFSSATQWADTTVQVLSAYSAVQAEQYGTSQADMHAGLQEALREIENNPHLPAEQKKMLQQSLQQSNQFLGELNNASSPADQALIRRNLARVDAAMGAEDD
ncbi:hypothetical protein [Alcanivorax quisquiliarum]|uniref:LTXXQ motif family protein n=1 Tax=Alcanivorax quisquiliarum TaxID=2933565 RepID=A0ABT0E7X5_9GAMM|nr:hypothetical protein [Alcanivorax quisquiliarum]MCK0537872.1 hypothetical protein [Alcanivorax quisquiliarum]